MILTIEVIDYIHDDDGIFNDRVIKLSDNTQMISSYDKVIKIARDECKGQTFEINSINLMNIWI